MYRESDTGENRLSSATVEGRTHLGAGWSANVPMIYDDLSSGEKLQYLFLDGSAYELDQGGMKVRNNQKSNILWYDLLDKRVYEDSSVSYGDNPRFADIAAAHGEVGDGALARSKYVLVFSDNSKWYFRSDGQAMMKEDRTGLNRIWYFYDAEGRLALVQDTVGRLIAFAYDGVGNLSEISWQVSSWKKDALGSRTKVDETRRVRYGYVSLGSGGAYPKSLALKGEAVGYRTPYALTRVTDPMGHATSYAYTEGVAGFTYDDSRSHSSNVYLLLTQIRSMVRPDGGALSEQVFEYNNTDGSDTNPKKYRKYFYTGYMEYFKVIRQSLLDRKSREMEATSYHYYDNGENGNNACYTAVLEKGKVKSEYRYSISGAKSQDDVLDVLSVSSLDGYTETHDYTYTAERTKSLETVYRGGKYAYAEKYQYDSKGRPTRVEDRLGLVTVTEWDPVYGVPVKEYKTLGVEGATRTYQVEWTLTSLGQVRSETQFLNTGATSRAVRTALNSYDPWGNLVSVENALGAVTHTDWDEETHAFPVRIWQDVRTASWSAGGDVEDNWRRDPDLESDGTVVARRRSWKEYNSDGSVWLEVDNEASAVERYYDELGAEIERVLPNENDERGFAGGEDVIQLGKSGYLAPFLSTRLDNAGTRMVIDYENDLVVTRTDIDKGRGEEKVTGVQKDGLGHVEAEIEYDGAGGEYSRKEMTYDALGRLIAITDQDAAGQAVSVTVGGTKVSRRDKTWLIAYDDIGRQKTIYYPETASGRTDRKLFTYDDAANAVTVVDADRRIVYQKKDWADDLVLVIEKGYGSGVEQTYKYDYDGLKRKTRFTDPRGIVTEYAYDERDLLIEQRYGEGGGSEKMAYDDAGRLVRKSDRNGQIVAMDYDELGRNTQVRHYASAAAEAAGTPSRSVKTVYDRRGNAVRISSEKLIEHYVYDAQNKVTALDQRLRESGVRVEAAQVLSEATGVLSFTYEYNDAGMITRMKYPDGSEHDFLYDGVHGRLERIDEGTDTITPFVTKVSYNKAGQVTRMEWGNGTREEWSFDSRKRISRLTVSGPALSLEDLAYTLSAAGNVLSIDDNTYTYDGFNRVATAKTKLPETEDRSKRVARSFGTYQNGGTVAGAYYDAGADLNTDGRVNGEDDLIASYDPASGQYDDESFIYDANGNRTLLVQNGDEYSYEYGPRNQLTKIWLKKKDQSVKKLFAEYTYDANGNTLTRDLYGTGAATRTEFTYDTLNRLVTTTSGGKTTSYAYDNAGNRLYKKNADGMTLYLRHGQIAVAMDVETYAGTSGEGKTKTGAVNRYVLSGDLLAGRITKTVLRTGTVTVAKSYYHLDHQNSTKLVTNEAGGIEVSYVYRAFGEQLRKLGTGDATYTYGGKELDGVTNLYYFNARYYDATIGRFINVDPVQDGANWYVYCENNPMNAVDPTGLSDIANLAKAEAMAKMPSEASRSFSILETRRKNIEFSSTMRNIVGTPYVIGGVSRSGVDCSGTIGLALSLMGYRDVPDFTASQMAGGEAPYVTINKITDSNTQGTAGMINFYTWDEENGVEHLNVGVGKQGAESRAQVVDATLGSWMTSRNSNKDQIIPAKKDAVNQTYSAYSSKTKPSSQGQINWTALEVYK
jgi:RHS repeat-associated protein